MTTAAPTPPAPITLEDASAVLGDYLASIMGGIDTALAEVGDDRWKDGVRAAVIREASHHALDTFMDQGVGVQSVERLEAEAVLHLGRYAVARARALSLKDLERRYPSPAGA